MLSFLRMSLLCRWLACLMWLCGQLGFLVTKAASEEVSVAPRFVQESPFAGQGKLVKCDLQHRFSTENLALVRFVMQAVDNGCQVVFVAPPTIRGEQITESQFLTDVETARRLFPKTVIFPAFAWEFRAPGVRDQAMIVFPTNSDFAARFGKVSQLLPAADSHISLTQSAGPALLSLCPDELPVEEWPVVILNQLPEGTVLGRWALAKSSSTRFWTPPSKKSDERRSFGQFGLLSRWSETEMLAGGEWDRLLGEGWNHWAAAGGSEVFPTRSADAGPGRSTETWLRIPELTPENVLQAIKHGAFFGTRRQLAREVELTVTVPGLTRAATSGETIDVPQGTTVRLELTLILPDEASEQQPSRLDEIQLVAITPELTRVVKQETQAQGRVTVHYECPVPKGGIAFRAQGLQRTQRGVTVGFYTNPIRVLSQGTWERPVAIVGKEAYHFERSSVLILAITMLAGFAVVVGWLVSMGKLGLLLSDLFAPVLQVWNRSQSRRRFHQMFPGLNQKSVDRSTVGNALTESECLWLSVTYFSGIVVLAAWGGWQIGIPRFLMPQLLSGLRADVCWGGMLGALVALCLRVHPFLALWLITVVKLAALFWPSAVPRGWDIICFSAALLALPMLRTLRMGFLKWPVQRPVWWLVGLCGLLVFSAIGRCLAPGWLGSGLHVLSLVAAASWSLTNLEWHLVPQRSLGALFLAVLWGGLQLSQGLPEDAALCPGLLTVAADALSMGLIFFAIRPERLDAIGLLLSQSALACLALWVGTESSRMAMEMTAWIAALGLLLLCQVRELPWLMTLSVVVSLLVSGRLLLFNSLQPGSWLLSAVNCVIAVLVSRRKVRCGLLLLPYVVASGYLAGQNVTGDVQTGSSEVAAFFSHELSAVKQFASATSGGQLSTAGQLVSLIAMAGLTALFMTTRTRNSNTVYEAAGRLWPVELMLGGIQVALMSPMLLAPGFVLLSFAGLWAAHLREEDVILVQKDLSADRNGEAIHGLQLQLLLMAGVVGAMITYGSLVPFQWQEKTLAAAVAEFTAQFQGYFRERAWVSANFNSDQLVNFLLTVPFAFCLCGSFSWGRTSILSRGLGAAEALQLSLVFSFLVELGQQWSVGRVASVRDVHMQAYGAVVGIVAWMIAGEWFFRRLARKFSLRPMESRWEQLLSGYVLAVIVFAVLPVGYPLTSPKELFDRFRSGQLSFIPFSDCRNWQDLLRESVAGLILFIPVGLWGAVAFRGPSDSSRSLLSAVWLGTIVTLVTTGLRVLCSAEMTDTSWLLCGVLGSLLGAATYLRCEFYAEERRAGVEAGWIWWVAALVFGGIVIGFFLHPWEFTASAAQTAAAWQQFQGTPFASFRRGNDLVLIEEVARKLGWFGAWGLLLGQAVLRSSERRLFRWWGMAVAIVLAGTVCLGIELAQLYQIQHSGESTDVLIGFLGAVTGLALRCRWLHREAADTVDEFRAERSDAQESWLVVLQTVLAIGVTVGLLAGVLILFLRH